MLIACHLSDPDEARCIAGMLRFEHVACEVFPCHSALIRATLRREFDVVILDGDLRNESQRAVMKWVQCRTTGAKVMLLSNEMRPEGIADALAFGIDELLMRPYSAGELITRVQVTVQRAKRARGERDVVEIAGFRLTRSSALVWVDGRRVELTTRESLMAWVFFSSPGVLLARETLGMSVWGAHSDVASRTIEQHVYSLRKKLAMDAARGVWIRTAYARGYRLEIDPHRLARAEVASACDSDGRYPPWNAPSAGIEQAIEAADAAGVVN